MRERDFACVLKNSLRFPRASAVKKLPMASTWKTRVNAFWREWGWILTAALLLTAAFRSAIADWNDVPSGSMEPTILIGDRIFVNKLAYDLKIPFTTRHLAQWNDPMRGDIVVFFSPENGKRLVKRVIGIPADEIALRDNRILLNGAPAQYDPLAYDVFAQLSTEKQRQHLFFWEHLFVTPHPVMFNPSRPSMTSFAPILVPNGQYFVMGDNRDNSEDSRFFGCIERRRIIGKATAIVCSFDYERHFRPRWHRFFSPLSSPKTSF